jgi:UDP-3-O-[3-hydroxymyristoyl] glucosamine N-acyltransferase
MSYTAAHLAQVLQGQVIGDTSLELRGFAPADRAKSGDLTFAENEIYFGRAEQSAASAILVDGPFVSSKKTLIKVSNSRIAFARVLPLFFPDPVFPPGVHSSAVVDPSAQIADSAHVGPGCIVGAGSRIGPRTVLCGNVFVSPACEIGEDCHLFANVTLYSRTQLGNRVRIHAGSVIGSDGFGYVMDEGVYRKIPQVGSVILQDDVEIGACVTIDRGALGPTVVGRGTKIDNLVQLGHNVTTGEHCILVSQTGIAGSTRLGNYVTLGGQVGLAGHLKLGNRVMVAAQSGVMHNIPDGEKWMGAPARPNQQMKRQFIALERLPDLVKRVAELEKKLEELQPQRGIPPTSSPPAS